MKNFGMKIGTKLTMTLCLLALIGVGCVSDLDKKEEPKEDQPIPQPTEAALPEPLDTSDWVLYENEELGIRFRHPEGYDISSYRLVLNAVDDDSIFALSTKENYPNFWIRVSSTVLHNRFEEFTSCSDFGKTGLIQEKVFKPNSSSTYTGRYCVFFEGGFYVISTDHEPYYYESIAGPNLGPYSSRIEIFIREDDGDMYRGYNAHVEGGDDGDYHIDFVRAIIESSIEKYLNHS